MKTADFLTGQLLEDAGLTIEQLAQACGVEPGWVEQHVQAGVLGAGLAPETASWRFRSSDLVRALRLLSLEREFDANEQLAALVVDLGDEVRRLRTRLAVLGVR